MNIIRLEKEDFIVNVDTLLKDVLVVITNNRKGSVVVIDSEEHFLGVASDGDIRRAMVKGATEFTPVEKFVNINAKYLNIDSTDSEIIDLFKTNSEITVLPLLSKNNIVERVAVMQ